MPSERRVQIGRAVGASNGRLVTALTVSSNRLDPARPSRPLAPRTGAPSGSIAMPEPHAGAFAGRTPLRAALDSTPGRAAHPPARTWRTTGAHVAHHRRARGAPPARTFRWRR